MLFTVNTEGRLTEQNKFPDNFLSYCYKQIECSLVDRVKLDAQTDMWVDDEGMFTQSINPVATVMARKYGYPSYGLYGNAVICGLTFDDEEGYSAGPLGLVAADKVRNIHAHCLAAVGRY